MALLVIRRGSILSGWAMLCKLVGFGPRGKQVFDQSQSIPQVRMAKPLRLCVDFLSESK